MEAESEVWRAKRRQSGEKSCFQQLIIQNKHFLFLSFHSSLSHMTGNEPSGLESVCKRSCHTFEHQMKERRRRWGMERSGETRGEKYQTDEEEERRDLTWKRR